MSAPSDGCFAVVPVKDLLRAKSRLGPALAPGPRAGLTVYMMGRVIRALREAGVEDVCVVSPDAVVLEMARERGAVPLLQESRGLNPALEEGRARAAEEGASSLLVLPADLPLLKAEDVATILKAGASGGEPSAVVCPDGARSGTNALLLRPPDALPFLFGHESYEAHRTAARKKGVEVATVERCGVSFDLDTGEDLARLGAGYTGKLPS